jgi:hypothetical protein
MSNSRLVRASRDGDQFHYLWAAPRCLRLLSSDENLVSITIEGASPSESPAPSEQVEAGEEIIDAGEYHCDGNFANALRVRYVQLKHSRLRIEDFRRWEDEANARSVGLVRVRECVGSFENHARRVQILEINRRRITLREVHHAQKRSCELVLG